MSSRCLWLPALTSRRPQAHKENALFLNAVILNSDEMFSRISGGEAAFKDKMRALFTLSRFCRHGFTLPASSEFSWLLLRATGARRGRRFTKPFSSFTRRC